MIFYKGTYRTLYNKANKGIKVWNAVHFWLLGKVFSFSFFIYLQDFNSIRAGRI